MWKTLRGITVSAVREDGLYTHLFLAGTTETCKTSLTHVVWHTYCTCIHVCQGDMQRQSVLFTLFIIECSKFLNSSTVMKKPRSVVPSTSLFELEQHPEGTRLKQAPVGTLILSPEGSGSEGCSSRTWNYFGSSTFWLILHMRHTCRNGAYVFIKKIKMCICEKSPSYFLMFNEGNWQNV